MSKDSEERRFHIPQPLRDPESNWEVNLAKNLEEYLLKICSGEVIGDDDTHHLSINFAEAALLLQGSVQVYSRKVEYLYTLVLHALEFLSQKRQQDQTDQTSEQPEGSTSNAVIDDENEPFLGLNDIPVKAKNCLDDGHSKGDTSNLFVKPPANLVVLEGDCFDSIGDVGELESYMLATQDLYRDFILLDTCDAGAIDKFLGDDASRNGNVGHRGSSVRSKTRKSSFLTPRRSGGNASKSPLGKTPTRNLMRTPEFIPNEDDGDSIWPDPPDVCDNPENDYHEGFPESDDESDSEDDPWKPLNPHEPGNLKVKPFKKGKNPRRQKNSSAKLLSLATEFPVARLHGTINPEYKEVWETLDETNRLQGSQSPLLYETLRESLDIKENGSCNDFTNIDNENNEDENDVSDFEDADLSMPESTFIDVEPPNQEMHDRDAPFGSSEALEPEDPQSQISLEDLCRSHLDALLANIAETEKQTELAARVSTWKQRIESTLEEQDLRPPFDIQEYGERVLDRLSLGGESGSGMSFTDVVRGQEKHNVARTFSALLQLVNNRTVDLDKGESRGHSVCYSAGNPFHVRLVKNLKSPKNGKFLPKKRGKSPVANSISKVSKTRN